MTQMPCRTPTGYDCFAISQEGKMKPANSDKLALQQTIAGAIQCHCRDRSLVATKV
jgi:hypothetical protein